MSDPVHEEQDPTGADLIRWTFAVDADHAEAVEAHLIDLGADVWVKDSENFQVFWEEPERDLDGVVEALWEMTGDPFRVTEETFRREKLLIVHDAIEDEDSDEEMPDEPDPLG